MKEANEEKVKDNSKIRPKNQKNEPYDTNVQNQSMTKDKSQLTTKDKYNR